MSKCNIKKINEIKKCLSEEVILFSDLHIGKKSNSASYHDTCLDYAIWLKEKANERNIETLIFLGDFFHDREEINLTSLHVGDQFLRELKEFNIIMIVGNHDCYYKHNAKIHSLSAYSEWENVIVIDETTVVDYLEHKVAFLPWGFNYDEIPTGVSYGFGHLEIESFKMNSVKICEKNSQSISSSDLLKKINIIFSGHFHVRSNKEYKVGKISYIGNTFEQDWSDYHEMKGVELFNFSTGETEFIENTISPKHIKVRLSKILSKDEGEVELIKKHFKNNYTKLIVDKHIDSDKLFAINSKLSSLNPLVYDTDFLAEVESKNVDDFQSVEIEMELLLTEFINSLDIVNYKDKILDTCLELYQRASKERSVE